MRLLPLTIVLLVGTVAPRACWSQVYYPVVPYTTSYAPSYSTYSPVIVEPPRHVTYYVPPQYVPAPLSSCACQVIPLANAGGVPYATTANYNGQTPYNGAAPYNASTSYRPSGPNPPVQAAEPLRATPKITYSASDDGKYNVFSNGGEIYAADSKGGVWRLSNRNWERVGWPIN